MGISVHTLNNELCPRYAMATSHLRQIDSKHANSMFPEILKVNKSENYVVISMILSVPKICSKDVEL